jgi:hypothetical protein
LKRSSDQPVKLVAKEKKCLVQVMEQRAVEIVFVNAMNNFDIGTVIITLAFFVSVGLIMMSYVMYVFMKDFDMGKTEKFKDGIIQE